MASSRKVCPAEGEAEATRSPNHFGRCVKGVPHSRPVAILIIVTQANQNLESQLRLRTFNFNILLCPSGLNAGHGRGSFTSTSSDPFVAFTTLFPLSLLANHRPKILHLIRPKHVVPYERSHQLGHLRIMGWRTTGTSQDSNRHYLPSISFFLCVFDPSSTWTQP